MKRDGLWYCAECLIVTAGKTYRPPVHDCAVCDAREWRRAG